MGIPVAHLVGIVGAADIGLTINKMILKTIKT